MKKTYQQLELILAEAERVNTVLVNDYTSLKERVRTLNAEVEIYKKKNTEFAAVDESQKEDIDRLNLIVEYEREQRFDLEQKNERAVMALNQQRIELLGCEDRIQQLQVSMQQLSETLKLKDDMVAQHESRALALEESMRGLKANFDETFGILSETKAALEVATKEKDDIQSAFSVTKQELEHAKEMVGELDTRVNDHQKLMEMEQTHRCNLETQLDELQLHTRKLKQQISDLTAKEKASEKVAEDQKNQILQLERVRDHFTLLLDKEKTSKGSLEQILADEEKKRVSNDADLVKLQESNNQLENQLTTLRNKYEQLESEKMDMVAETNEVVQKLSEEVDALKTQLEADSTTKQDAGSRQKERERELYNKVKETEDALQKERERALAAEESVLQLRKKHRDELENIQLRSSSGAANDDHNENGTDDHENGANGVLEQKLKQNLSEEKQELEKLSQSLSEARNRYIEDLQKFDNEKATLLQEYQKMEEKKGELDEREADIKHQKDELAELEKQVQEIERQKEALSVAQKKLNEESNSLNDARTKLQAETAALESAKAEIVSEREKLAQDKLNTENNIKLMQEEREQIETEKKTLAEEKSDIDNELSRLVEHKLQMQQEKQAFEDRESELISIIKEKESKIEEVNHALAEERKQKENLEFKYSAGQKSPDSKGEGLGFSYFKTKKTKANDMTLDPANPATDNLTDEERKLKLFNEYQLLLTEINTTLFQKREQVNETENSGGNYFKKMGLGSLKTSVTKLEDLQGRVKKAFRAVDSKEAFTALDEQAEQVTLKAFRHELT